LDKPSLSSKRSDNPRFFYGYIVVIAAFCVMAVQAAGIYSFGVFLKPVSAEFEWSRALTSGAHSICMVVTGLLCVVAGRLTDSFGPRLVVTVGGICFGVGYLLMSQITASWQLYLFWGVMVGMGLSIGFVPMASTAARWFTKKRGLLVGIVVSGVSVGTMFGPPLSSYLILSYGWPSSYMTFGIISLVLLVLFAQFLSRDPSQKGLLPYGGEVMQGKSIPEVGGLYLREAVRTRQLRMLFIVYILFGMSQMAVMVHIVPHATDIGVSPIAAANIMTIIGGVGIAGRVIFGGVADRYGNKRALVIGLIMLAVALFLLQSARELWMLYLFAAIFGFGYGGEAAIMAPLVAELFGLRAHGAILGLTALAFHFGCAIGPLLAGRMFDVAGSYYSAFLVCAVFIIAGIILVLFLRSPRRE